jgi:DNA-binding transcriptional MerR regulator/methylmalonyl-CoA mutase cobalamin-binding subunit
MYRIGTIADLVGIPRNTLLAWERRYQLLTPERTQSGYRLYDDEDLSVLKRIKVLLDEGYRISEAIDVLQRERRQQSPGELHQVKEEIRRCLLAFDRPAADVAQRQLGAYPFAQRIEEVYLPMLVEVGDAWHQGEVTVAQEHHVSAFVREQLLTMLDSVGGGPSQGPVPVCAGMPGETHEIGLLAAAVKLALSGWRVSYFGLDLPNEEVAAVARILGAEVVCQAAVRARPPEELEAHLRDLRIRLGRETQVVVGGVAVAGKQSTLAGVRYVQRVEELGQ